MGINRDFYERGMARKVLLFLSRAVRPLCFICGPNRVTLECQSNSAKHPWPLCVDYSGVLVR